jgi:hypothetical protein
MAEAERSLPAGSTAIPIPPGPMPVYPIDHESAPETVVIYCSDPRFQTAFDSFIANDLHLAKGDFVPIVIAGGGGALARPHELPKEFKFIKERLELAREYFPSVRRVVLINHEDCRYYESLRGKVFGLIGARLSNLVGAREDLPTIATVFARFLTHLGLDVELYYAHFADGTHNEVVFERVGK